MSGGTHTHWRMTINNYDETDLALVQQGYPDYIRQLVYTLEEGEEGTPHIQAYIKMKRDTRFSAMKKLFPRGNFAFIDNDEYKLNSQRYAQKLDATARSPAVITNFEPIHTIEGIMKRVMRRIEAEMGYHEYTPQALHQLRIYFEKRLVEEDYTMAKVFVSATYKQMWKQFGEAMYSCLAPQFAKERMGAAAALKEPHTHTHTHSEKEFSRDGGITEDAAAEQDTEGQSEDDASCGSGDTEDESDDYVSGSSSPSSDAGSD